MLTWKESYRIIKESEYNSWIETLTTKLLEINDYLGIEVRK